MIKRLIGLVAFTIGTLTLSAQGGGNLILNFSAGVADYRPTTDFQRTVYFREGRPYNAGNGNITEPNYLPFARVDLTYGLNDRWRVSPFVQYMTGKGTLFEDSFTIFGATDTNPEERIFTRPAPNETSVLTVGLSASYLLVNGPYTSIQTGIGLAYMHRSHTYREYLEVNFSDTYDPLSIQEEFVTFRKSALGIPVSFGINQQLTAKLSAGLRMEGQFHPNLADAFWAGGLNLGFRL